MLDKDTIDRLLVAAKSVMSNAHVPYSSFHVGASILYEDGSIEVGCNVENASFGATICAERTAISSGIAKGNACAP